MDRDARRLLSGVISTAVLLALLLAVGLAIPDLRGVLDRMSHASGAWIMVGIGLELLSCLGYVAVVRLVLHRGPKRQVRWLAWSEMAFGAVVGAGGAGSLAVGAWAMRAWGIPWSRIANRSAVIFMLTTAVNATVLTLAGFGVGLGIGSHETGIVYGFLPAGVAGGGLVVFMLLPRVAKRAPRLVRGLASWVADTESVVFSPDWRLLGAFAYLLCDIAVLWACLRAVGVDAPILALVLGYQIGYLANLIPVPGGVGVLEGGLLGALLLYGLPAAPTAAAVVLYHAIALWVPTLGGTIGFSRLRRAMVSQRAAVEIVPGENAPASAVADSLAA